MAATKTFGRRGIAPVCNAPSRATSQQPAVAVHGPTASPAEIDGGDLFLAQLPILTVGMIVCLFFIYGFEKRLAFDISGKGELSLLSLTAFGASGYDLVVGAGELWRPFLAPLLHSSFSHFLGNSFALFFVGLRLEPLIGRWWFAAIFAISAIGGGIGSMIGNPHMIVTVGASGAITGLVGALFMVSFSHRAEEQDQRAMRMTALKFGIPALAPLAFGAAGHTDYFAHLGGAVAGAAIAWAICAVWSEDRFRPDFTGFAAGISLTCLSASVFACLFAAHGYASYGAKAALFIPSAERPKDLRADERRSATLLARYPQDPLAHVIRAIYLADHGGIAVAETQLREALAIAGTDAQSKPIRDLARTILAVVLRQEGRQIEAMTLTADICRDPAQAAGRQILRKAHLCR